MDDQSIKNKGGRPKGTVNCGKCKKPKSECNCGRPKKITPKVLAKLEEAFMHTFTDEEACLYADINPSTLYRYQDENPEFSDRKRILRLTPNMHAKKMLVAKVEGSLDQSRWWAKNKMRNEFSEKTEIEHSGSIGGLLRESEDNDEADKLTIQYNKDLRAIYAKGKPGPKEPESKIK